MLVVFNNYLLVSKGKLLFWVIDGEDLIEWINCFLYG